MVRSRSSTLALLGGRPIGPVEQPVYPCFTERSLRRVEKILREGRLLGFSRGVPEVRKAEEALSRHLGGGHGVTCAFRRCLQQ